jgi:hypothetical protein
MKMEIFGLLFRIFLFVEIEAIQVGWLPTISSGEGTPPIP